MHTRSAVDGHWVVFGSCGFVNNAAWVLDLHGHVLSFLIGGYLGIELLDHMETLYLTFQKLPKSLYHVMFSLGSGGVVSLGHYEDNGGTSG